MEIIYGQTLFVRGLPKEWSDKRKYYLLTALFERYGQLDHVQVAPGRSHAFVTFYKPTALRFVLKNETARTFRVQGHDLECSKAFKLQRFTGFSDGLSCDVDDKLPNQLAIKDNRRWWVQVPINIDHLEPFHKKKKPRHKKCDVYMSLLSPSSKKVIKKTKKQRNKKVKKQNKLYEPQPFPGYYDNPLHKTYGPAGKGSLIKPNPVINNQAELARTTFEEKGGERKSSESSLKEKNAIPGKSNETGMAFIRLLSGFVMHCPVNFNQSLDEQILDIENVCGQFPNNAYFLHGGKTVLADKSFQAQGIVGDCNIEVLLRLQGGGRDGGGGEETGGGGRGNRRRRNRGEGGADEDELKELEGKISNLESSEGKPEDIEVEVRALFSEIDSLEDTSRKKKFLSQLTALAIKGLDEDLQKLLKENGVSDKSLQLVRDYTTKRSELAKKLYLSETTGTDKDKSDSVLATKLLPKLETLGALLSNSIQESLTWVNKLIEESPNLTQLRRMKYGELDTLLKEASDGDRSVVESLFAEGIEIREQCQRYGIGLKTAEKLKERGIKSPGDMTKEELHKVIKDAGEEASAIKKMYHNESSERAAERKQLEEKTKKTKERTQEAKKLAEEARKITQEASEKSKKVLHDKMKEIADKLSLPEGWDKQEKDDPNALLEQLDKEINIASDSLALSPYVSNEEVAAAASGGLALYGILFDDHDIEGFSESAPFPFLKRPAHVEWLSPALGFVVRFFKSTESNASTKFYKTAKSSGLSIAASVSGGGWGFHADASTAHSSEESKDTSEKRQENTTHATITQYISQPTGAFRIPREEMELSDEAKTRAAEIKDDESAERFLKNFGSHVSEGVHTLGGVFFRNLDVNTEREAKVSDVMMAAGKQLDVDVSAGYSGFGVSVGGSVKTDTFDASGSRDASSSEKISYMSEMTVQTLGPPTTNQAMFSQLLQSNNATWHVIDRGNHTALVPVWQLMSEQEGLKKQAEHLENAWKKKQKEKEVTRKQEKIMVSWRKEIERKLDVLQRELKIRIGGFIWPARGFKALRKSGNVVRSPYFYSWKGGYKLYIEIYPQGSGLNAGTHLSIFVHASNQGEFQKMRQSEIAIVLLSQQEDKENRVLRYNLLSQLFDMLKIRNGWGFSNFMTLEELENSPYLKNDTIFIQVDITKRIAPRVNQVPDTNV